MALSTNQIEEEKILANKRVSWSSRGIKVWIGVQAVQPNDRKYSKSTWQVRGYTWLFIRNWAGFDSWIKVKRTEILSKWASYEMHMIMSIELAKILIFWNEYSKILIRFQSDQNRMHLSVSTNSIMQYHL